jgi:hypothetical protein
VKKSYTRVQFSLTLGGPIQKDKTFLFFSYELTRREETGFTAIGQDNFGFVNSNILPPNAGPCPLPASLVTPTQEAFVASVPAGVGIPYLCAAAGELLKWSHHDWAAACPPEFFALCARSR